MNGAHAECPILCRILPDTVTLAVERLIYVSLLTKNYL